MAEETARERMLRQDAEEEARNRARLTPGGANPPPGWLASSVMPSLNPIGGQEVSPLAVSGQAAPIGPPVTTPGGQTITPVARPATAAPTPNPIIDTLSEQFKAINGLLGPAPQQPVVRDQIEGGGTIVAPGRNGMAGLYSGPTRVTADPGSLADLASFNQQNAGRGQDVGQLLSRIGAHERSATDAFRAMTERLAPGHAEQTQANTRGAGAYQAALSASYTTHPERSAAEHHEYASGTTGIPTERYRQMIGAVPAPRVDMPGSVPTAPSGTQTVQSGRNSQGISTTREGATETPYADIERHLNRVSGYVPPTPATDRSAATPEVKPNGTIGEFVNRLEVERPGMLAEHFPAIQNYMIRRYGEAATRSALRTGLASTADTQGIGSRISSMFGQNDNESGLSVLGNLQQAIAAAGGHENFLRQQRQPPLP